MHIARYVHRRHQPHAFVREDDTHGVLAADPVAKPVDASLPALERAARLSAGRSPGTVVFLPGRPARIHAVIHALEQEPTWRSEWIVAAALASFSAAHRRELTTLAMPLLGTVHAGAPIDHAVDALTTALHAAHTARPHHLLIEGAPETAVEALAQRAPRASGP